MPPLMVHSVAVPEPRWMRAHLKHVREVEEEKEEKKYEENAQNHRKINVKKAPRSEYELNENSHRQKRVFKDAEWFKWSLSKHTHAQPERKKPIKINKLRWIKSGAQKTIVADTRAQTANARWFRSSSVNRTYVSALWLWMFRRIFTVVATTHNLCVLCNLMTSAKVQSLHQRTV